MVLHLLQLVNTEKELVGSELEKAVLNKLERDAWRALDKFGRHAQVALKLKINTLESAIQWAEQE